MKETNNNCTFCKKFCKENAVKGRPCFGLKIKCLNPKSPLFNTYWRESDCNPDKCKFYTEA